MSTVTDLEIAYLDGQGASAGTLADKRAEIYGVNEHAHYAALSGLTPAARYSLADHKMAYFKAQTGLTEGSLSDLAVAFFGA